MWSTPVSIDKKKLTETFELAEDQTFIRQELSRLDLAAFVADGSVLPRQSGVSDLPMKDSVVFSSPDSLRVTLTLPHRGKLSGMGIPRGITLIVGGGYHGKSTLLKAQGICHHRRHRRQAPFRGWTCCQKRGYLPLHQ